MTTHGQRKLRLLYIVHRVPYPPDKGDRIRAYHIARYLSSRGDLYLACLADEPVAPGVTEHLLQYCRQVAIEPQSGLKRAVQMSWWLCHGRTASEGAFWSNRLAQRLRSWADAEPFDIVLLSSSALHTYLDLPELRNTPAIVDMVDVDSQKWHDYAQRLRPPARWLYRLESRRLMHVERLLARRAQAVTVVSRDEAELFRRVCPDGPVHAVTNGVDLSYFSPDGLPAEKACVFVGALNYFPNVEGMVWFCQAVWPELRKRHKDAHLYIVGRQPCKRVVNLARNDHVHVIGSVPDVRPYLYRASVAIAPLRIARGVQNKVLEALAVGRPVVASPQALEGLGVTPGQHVFCAREPQEWVAVLDRLLTDPQLGAHIGQAGRRYVEQFHQWESCLAPLGDLIHQLARTPRHSLQATR